MNNTPLVTNCRATNPALSLPISVISKTGLSLLLASLLTGCWAPSVKPSAAEFAQLRTVLIVPVQSPPLEVVPDLLEQRDPAYRHYQNMALGFPAQTTVHQTPGGITVTGLSFADERAGMDDQVAANWSPAKAAASKARRLLSLENIKGVLSQDAYHLPVTEATGVVGWHEAIQAWYGLAQTASDYRSQGRFDAILEVGVGSYRIFEGQTSLQLLTKLIDPASGRVIARTRADSFTVDDEALNSIGRDGAAFKQLIADMSVPLLRQCLGDMGLRAPAQSDDS